MGIDSNTAITQLQAIQGVRAARHYVVVLRKMQECFHLGIVHIKRLDTKDNPADHFTKALPSQGFWRLTTKIMGDAKATHHCVGYRKRLRMSESHGGSVKEMRADLYAERKERAREVNERKAQKKASDATTKQLQLRSIIANAELAKCLFINERDRTQDHMDLPD